MGTQASILVVDDDIVAAELLAEVLTKEGYDAQTATCGLDAVRMGEEKQFDVVITDLNMPDISGLDVLKAFKKSSPQTFTIVITAFGSFETAIKAIQNGAYDYISKPFKMDDIKQKVSAAIEQQRLLRKQMAPQEKSMTSLSFIIGNSPKMLEIYKLVAKVAGSDVTVLIQGESGTGKELVARAIHDNSPRAEKHYVAINCAALPETLLESELFGHAKGAFTGAMTDKKGLLEEADGGTCFLDEIGDMSLPLQTKLLRVLQDHEIRRVGGNQSVRVDIRVLSATNRDLAAMVKSGQFREDLYYRLNVVTIKLPALREHPEDISPLADHFLRKSNLKTNKNVRGISKEAMGLLMRYDWPGNIRQLENAIERAVALTTNAVLLPSDIPEELQQMEEAPKELLSGNFHTLEEIKKQYIQQVLKRTGGNQNLAAEILGINRKTLYRMLKEWEKEDKGS